MIKKRVKPDIERLHKAFEDALEKDLDNASQTNLEVVRSSRELIAKSYIKGLTAKQIWQIFVNSGFDLSFNSFKAYLLKEGLTKKILAPKIEEENEDERIRIEVVGCIENASRKSKRACRFDSGPANLVLKDFGVIDEKYRAIVKINRDTGWEAVG